MYIRPFSVSEADKEVIDRYIRKLVLLGVLTPGLASQTSAILLVKKKDGTERRACCDLRVLNSLIVKVNYPFPMLKDILAKLDSSGCTVPGHSILYFRHQRGISCNETP